MRTLASELPAGGLSVLKASILAGKPQALTLWNGAKVTIVKSGSTLRIETGLNIAVETTHYQGGLLDDLLETLLLKGNGLRNGLRRLTETYRLIWETSPPLQNAETEPLRAIPASSIVEAGSPRAFGRW